MLALAFLLRRCDAATNKQMKKPQTYVEGIESVSFKIGDKPYRNSRGQGWRAGMREIFREDTGETLGIVGPNYRLTQHCHVLDKAREAFDELGLKPEEPRILAFDNGGEMRAKFIVSNGKAKKTAKVGDALAFALDIRNGINGEVTLDASGGIQRLICSNGMVGMRKATTAFSKKHNGGLSLAHYRDAIVKLMKTFAEDVADIRKLVKIEFSHDAGINLLNHLIKDYLKTTKADSTALHGYWNNPDSQLLTPHRGQNLEGIAGDTRNAWQAYNACTALYRDMERERGAFDIAHTKRQSLARVFGSIASGKRDIAPMLEPIEALDEN
tara:strand:- start:390 stop:1367 length:978 start_codon:yes stop_codon:yes gene_type:complete